MLQNLQPYTNQNSIILFFSTFTYSNWVIPVGGTGLGRSPVYGVKKLVWRSPNEWSFKTNKTYQYITYVDNFYSSGLSFSMDTPWGDFMDFDTVNRYGTSTDNGLGQNLIPPSPGHGYLHFYSNTPNAINTKDIIINKANENFGVISGPQEKLYDVRVNEIDFDIQGWAWWRDSNSRESTSLNLDKLTDGLGWAYYEDTKSYVWFDDNTGTIGPAIKINTGTDERIVNSNSKLNYLVKFIPLSFFNLSFQYDKLSGYDSDGLSIYLSQDPPQIPITYGATSFLSNNATIVATYTQSSSTFSSYFGLQGNQFLIITASASNGTPIRLTLSDIQISGGYWPGNNRQYLATESGLYENPTTINPIGLTGATYSAYVGTGNTYNATQSLEVSQVFSKIGNGSFTTGIWENGVWNSGWRDDEETYELYSIGRYFAFEKGLRWRFEIVGPESSVSKLNVGDKISIGNIVAIDFNEERKLLKKWYPILGKTNNSIIIEITNNFPLKRIQRDSDYHRILVTKNVWLTGVFLNGYYSGVWNLGLFKGFPLLTEMYNTHWIDGQFDGGHFYSQLHSLTFSDITLSKGKIGITFSQPHKLNVGDEITIDKTDKTVNSSYDGTASVEKVVDEYSIITNKKFVSAATTSQTGVIYTSISSGLVQNFKFDSHNVSTGVSTEFLDSDAVFIYNSWMDINFYTYSAVNIGRKNTIRNTISKKELSQNNLYGYPTNDVLSSVSKFRNSYNLREETYNLGNKWKIYNDFVGEASSFERYFDSTLVDPTKFLELGWTYSSASVNSIIFNRSEETRIENTKKIGTTYSWINVNTELLVGSELQVDARGSGGVLNLVSPIEEINFRNNSDIKKDRYTLIEFDLARWNAKSAWFQNNDSPEISPGKYKGSGLTEPILHFDNLNTTKRDIYYGGFAGTASTTVQATYFPIYENINHLLTTPSKKREYFFNKTNLSFNFRGSGFFGSTTASVLIDNLKFYEVDMIPFFQYFTQKNINFGLQTPYQGIAPFIDYTNTDFSFLDNLSIGFDSFSVNPSNIAFSGIGPGIGTVEPDTIFDVGVLADTGNTAGNESQL